MLMVVYRQPQRHRDHMEIDHEFRWKFLLSQNVVHVHTAICHC